MADSRKELIHERLDEYERLKNQLASQGYSEKNSVISIVKANFLAIVTAGPICLIFISLYCLFVHDSESIYDSDNFFIIMVFAIISIPIHELLHGLGWMLFCKNGKKSISFGVIWKYLTPYCHCSEPLSIGRYCFGTLVPCMILGLIPAIAALFSGSVVLLAVGVFNILAAGGDLTIVCMLIKYIGKKVLILDHPSECGCAVFIPEKSEVR